MDNLVQRVVMRYAGIIEPPPKMVEEIVALLGKYWAAGKFAETGDPQYQRMAGRTKILLKGQTVSKKVKVNLAGWKYGGKETHRQIREHIQKNMTSLYDVASQGPTPEIFKHLFGTYEEGVRKMLDAAKTVQVDIHGGAGTASWMPTLEILNFYAGQHDDLDALRRTVVHELRHFAQSLISRAITGLPTSHVGLPSQKILTPEWEKLSGGDAQEILEQYNKGLLSKQDANLMLRQIQTLHHLKDIEFDTDLGDAVHDFKAALQKSSITIPGGKKIALQLFTGQHPSYPAEWDGRKKFQYMVLLKKWGFEPSRFFADLRDHAPAKYRMALKKMYQEVGHLLKEEPNLIQYAKQASRPVPLDWKIVDDLINVVSKRIRAYIEARLAAQSDKTLLGDVSHLGDTIGFTLTNMEKKPVSTAKLILMARNKPATHAQISGGAGKIGGAPGIVLELNGGHNLASWLFLSGYEGFKQQLKLVISHEYTHLVDALYEKDNKRPTTKGVKGPLDPDAFKKYLNQPHEIRARMQEVILDAIPTARKLHKVFKGKDLVHYLFAGTLLRNTWSEIKDDLTPENKKKIQKAVAYALQQEGLL